MWLNEFGGIDEVVFYVFCAVSAIILILAIANILVSCCCKQAYGGATSMDFNITCGSIVLSYTVLVRGLQPDYGDKNDLEVICQFYPAALIIGLTLFMGGLMVKSWGTFLYSKYNRGTKQPLSEEWKPNLWIWFLVIVAAAVSVAWCVEFTPMLEEASSEMNETMYECTNHNGHDFEWQVATSVWHAFLLFMAVLATIPNCATSKTPETNILSLVTVNTLFAVVAGVCLFFLYDKDATVNYAINGALILWLSLFANIMFLVSKILSNRRETGGMSETQDNYDTINSHKQEAGARNDGYLEPEEGEVFQY